MNIEEPQKSIKNVLTLFIIIEYSPQRYISMASLNQRKRLFEICSLSDNEHYSNLQSLLIQMNPKQSDEHFFVHVAIKTEIKSEINKIVQKLAGLDYQIEEGNKSTNCQYDFALQFLLKQNVSMYLQDFSDKKAYSALQKLMSVLNLQKDDTNKGQINLQTVRLQKYMKMDRPAINALQIFPKDIDNKITIGTNTLFQILNKCKTQIGVRCLKRWMKQPLQNLDMLQARLDKVQFFIKNSVIRNLIQNQLKKLPDLDNLYHVFYKVKAGKKSNVEVNDLIKMYRTVKVIQQLVNTLQQKNLGQQSIDQLCKDLSQNLKIVNQICKMIEDTIILQQRDSQCHVRPDAQQILTQISKKQQKIRSKIDQHIKQLQKQLKFDIQKVSSTNQRYVLEADKKKSIQIVKQNSQLKYLTAKQNKISFTTNTLKQHCRDLDELEQQYHNQEKGILKTMFNVVAGYYSILEQLSSILSEVDVLMGFATAVNINAGSQTPWVRPQFRKQGLIGQKIHHPCIRNCIPNDCDLFQNRTIILTGPNMGGKSTYIRTIGVAVYLAHIGCYVPAKKFQTPIIDTIITRVGASDMQTKGISTFMSQMIQSSCMLHSSTNRSLVLIDELGRGTSTAEGFGTAWAICHYLHTKINPYCLFATHFHEMTKMEDEVAGVKNMFTSCKMQNNKLNFEYLVLPGKIQKSYGIQVAKILDFPQHIIKQAENYLSLYQKEGCSSTGDKQHSSNSKNGLKMMDSEKQAIRLYQQMQRRLISSADTTAITNQYKLKIKHVLNTKLVMSK